MSCVVQARPGRILLISQAGTCGVDVSVSIPGFANPSSSDVESFALGIATAASGIYRVCWAPPIGEEEGEEVDVRGVRTAGLARAPFLFDLGEVELRGVLPIEMTCTLGVRCRVPAVGAVPNSVLRAGDRTGVWNAESGEFDLGVFHTARVGLLELEWQSVGFLVTLHH